MAHISSRLLWQPRSHGNKWINQYCFIQKWLVVRDARYGTRAIPYLQGLATKAISAINVVARHLVYPQAVLLAQSHNIGNGC